MNTEISLPVHTVEEMKATIQQYSLLKNELKNLQTQTKALKQKRDTLSDKMKVFMRFNQLTVCHVSESVQTDIRKIRFIQKDKKQRVTMKMVETYFEEFFNTIDAEMFLQLTNKGKSEAFFDFLETKRPRTVLDCIMIR